MTDGLAQTPCPLSIEDISPDDLERYSAGMGLKPGYLTAKRCLDILLSLALLLLFLPLLLVVAALVRLDSPGPALYRTRRYGRDGATFEMLKFRSMTVAVAADDLTFRSRVSQQGLLAKSSADPRLTRVGRRIRQLSIDELPQLFNVLRGEMSLVGPRPVLPEMLHRYPLFCRARTLVRPGLGGLWQVRERANATHVGFMWRHDLEYLHRMSMRLDLWIIVQSALAALKRTGAT